MSFNQIIGKVIVCIYYMNKQAEEGDILQNHINYGMVQAYVYILQQMGHVTVLKNCQENKYGCYEIEDIYIDSKALPI